jgi:hypothetical protein
MVKDQHPQAAKEAAGNVLPAWLDAFKVLLDLDPEQDVSGEHWDGLEIRFQIFKVCNAFFSPPNHLLRNADPPHDTHVIFARGSSVFAGLRRRCFASPPRTLPNVRAVLSYG